MFTLFNSNSSTAARTRIWLKGRGLTLCLMAVSVVLLSACAVYKPDTAQGNVVTSEQVAALKVGMTRQQVQQTLGSPLLQDLFNTNRWDYVYRNQKGNGALTQRALTVFFDATGKLERWVGQEAPQQDALSQKSNAAVLAQANKANAENGALYASAANAAATSTATAAILPMQTTRLVNEGAGVANATDNTLNPIVRAMALTTLNEPQQLSLAAVSVQSLLTPTVPAATLSAVVAAPVLVEVSPAAPPPIAMLSLAEVTAAAAAAPVVVAALFTTVSSAPINQPAQPVMVAPASLTSSTNPMNPTSVPQALSFDITAVITSKVLAWRDAWIAKDVVQYAGFYAEGYKGDAASAGTWLAQRKRIIDVSENISINLSNVKVIQTSDQEARATFVQDYRSNRLVEKGLKNLFFQKLNNDWKIVAERFIKQS